MRHPGRLTKLVAVLFVVASCALPVLATKDGDTRRARFAGLSLSAALDELRRSGLEILFSSDLVRPDMIVRDEPRGGWPNEILDQLLAPHGLRSRLGPSGALLVVPAPPSGSIEGTVRLSRTGVPLPGIRIQGSGGIEATTDSDGRFRLGPLPEGNYRLETVHPGYVPRKLQDIHVRAASVTRVGLVLDPKYASAEEVIVRARAAEDAEGGTVARESVGAPDLLAQPTVAHDPLAIVGRVPGVAMTDGAGALHIRGGEAREAKILLDGLEILAPYHLEERGGPISVVDARDLGEVGVLAGAFPAQYGGEMSAVVEMRTLDPPTDDRSIGVALGTEDARVDARGSLGEHLSGFVSARRGDPSRMLDGLGADPAYRPRYGDLLAKAEYRIGDTTVSSHLLFTEDSVEGSAVDERIFPADEPGTFRDEHAGTYAWLTIRHPFTPRVFSETLVRAGQVVKERDGSNEAVLDVRDQRSIDVLGLKQDWLLIVGARSTLKLGFDFERLRAEYDYTLVPAPGDPELDAAAFLLSPSGSEIGVYVSDRVQVTPKASIEMGLRWDRATWVPGSSGTLSPRFNAVYALGPRTFLRAGWGTFHQPQRIDELQVEDGVATFHDAARAEHRIVSLEHALESGLSFQVTAYQKRMTDLSPRYENLFDPFGFFPEAAQDRVVVDADTARADGVELAVESPEGQRVSWWAAYALSRAEDRVGATWVARGWDQRNALQAGIRVRLADRWDLSVTGTHHSGRPTTPATATPLPDGTFELVPAIGARNTDRLPSYHRIDARLGRTIPIRGTVLVASLTVANLLDRDNPSRVTGFTVEPRPDGSAAVHPILGNGLPRLVAASLEWRF